MDIMKRLFRRPVSTAVWLAVLTLAALLLGVAASLYASALGIPAALDARGMTIAVQKCEMEKYGDGSYGITPSNIVLYEEDIDYLRSLPQVKDVDFRYLSGAYIEGLTAKLGLTSFHGNYSNALDRANESYCGALIIGTVEMAWPCLFESVTNYDLSAVGGGENVGEMYECAVLRVDKAISLHPDYPLSPQDGSDGIYDGRVTVRIPVYKENGELFFKKGRSYVVQGNYDPTSCRMGEDPLKAPFTPHIELDYKGGFTSCFFEDGVLVHYTDCEVELPNILACLETGSPIITKVLSRDGRVPVAAEWSGTEEELLADEYWGSLAKELDMSLSCFPVLGTNNLESMYSFIKNEASIVEGRSFTEEEYADGAKVLVLDEEIAKNAGLSVGSRVSLRQFNAAVGSDQGNASVANDFKLFGELSFNNPSLGTNVFVNGMPGDAEEFTVVGLYRLENEWKDGLCSFTPNTVFMPRGAQTEDAFGGPSRIVGTKTVSFTNSVPDENGDPIEGEPDTFKEPIIAGGGISGVYMSVILKNGSIDAFLKRLEADSEYTERDDPLNPGTTRKYYSSGLGGHNFLCFDQGFDTAKESMWEAVDRTGRLALLMAAGAVLLFAMFMLIHQSSEQKNLGIMRSLGAEPKKARDYLFVSGLIIAAVGFVLGSILSGFLAGGLTFRLVGAAMGGETALFREMLAESSVPAWVYPALALSETLLAALALFVQASAISKKAPRRLLGK